VCTRVCGYRLGVRLLEIVGRSLVVYVAVLAGLRLGGRRELGQLTPFDLVVILLVANAVQNAMVGPDVTLEGGLMAAATLLAANAIVARTRLRSRFVRGLVEGEPILLVHDGQFIQSHLRIAGVTQDEVETALREHGEDPSAGLSGIKMAVLEPDGSISIVPTTANVQRTDVKIPVRRAQPRRRRHRKSP
jgi:uncharacterized membrane protein YcaP (DUF421 family)